MLNIQLHTFGLARYTYIVLSCLCHSNGKPVAQIHCDNDFQNIAEQGAILNFSLLDCHGRTVGYSQVSQELPNVTLFLGCVMFSPDYPVKRGIFINRFLTSVQVMKKI